MFQKFITIITVIFMCSSVVSAQDFQKSITGKGIKIGPGYSAMNTTYDEIEPYFETKTGTHLGVFLTYQISPKLSIQPELLSSVKGASTGGILTLFNWSINYIEVPVFVKYNLGDHRAVKPNIYVGPSLSFLISSELKIIFVDPIDVTDGLKSTDLGFVFGGGFDYKHFVFDVRYTIGMTNIIDSDKINTITGAETDDFYYFSADPEVKNSFLSIMIGFKF